MKRVFVSLVGAVAAVALLALNMGAALAPAEAQQGHAMTAMTTSTTKASGLRSTLNTLFQEHIYLAAAATGAALGGREAEFKAAAAALDANSVSISKAIGSVYGQGAEDAFLPLWRKHIGMVVDYTVGVAANDKAKQDKAVADLIGYTQDFGAFLQSANPNLPKSVVADLVKHHVVTLKEVIDAQASKDQAKTYTAMRIAAGHMQRIADPLAEAIVKQFPDKFGS
jgi:hypothetical protein